MKTTAPAATRHLSPATQFRSEIERAEAAGAERKRMTLRLTLGDASQLRRDRSLPVKDISFKDGVMRYLGVKIVQGGVTESTLDVPAPKSKTPAPAAAASDAAAAAPPD